MKILLAGANGAIGRALTMRLVSAGHAVVGLVRSSEAADVLTAMGADTVAADVLDRESVYGAVNRAKPDAIINELTSLPKHYTPAEMNAAAETDRRVRLEGNTNLLAAAKAVGIQRYLLQSSGFWYAPGPGLAEENAPFASNATPGVAASVRTYAQLEADALQQTSFDVVILRYGFFYGPGTWYTKEGDIGEQVRSRQVPVVGAGQGVWSFVQIEDAAEGTVAALQTAPGTYNIVDDDPSPQCIWLPAFARYAGASEPPHITEEEAVQTAGPDPVYYATSLRGASNKKAKRALGFKPRPLDWLQV